MMSSPFTAIQGSDTVLDSPRLAVSAASWLEDLKPIYTAANAEAAEAELASFDQRWGERYPMIAEAWRSRWEQVIPFLALPADLRRLVYTTNTIENLNRQIRKAIKTRGHFPDEQAATKLIYLAICRAETKWRSVYNWTAARRALKIHFGDRTPTDYDEPTSPTSHTEGRTVSWPSVAQPNSGLS